MISRLIFRMSMIAATLAIALSSVTPALANVIEKWTEYWSFDGPIGQCGNGKTLMEAGEVTDDFISSIDKNGDPFRLNIHEYGSSKAYLEGSPEKFVPGFGNWSVKVYGWDKQINNFMFFSITGVTAKYVVPGYGIILHDAGNMKFDMVNGLIFEAGKHQWDHQDFDAICDYLAQMP